MKRRNGLWRFFFHAGLIGCTLALVAYAASIPWCISMRVRHPLVIGLQDGAIFILWTPFTVTVSLPEFPRAKIEAIEERRRDFQWWFWVFPDDRRYTPLAGVVLPLWAPVLLFASLTAFAWFRSRQQRLPGRCASCGYDLTGNVTGRCPECGKSVACL